MSDALILALDAGSQSLRAALFARDGAMLATSAVQLPDPTRPQPDFAESDPEALFEALGQACTNLAQQAPDEWSRVVGITLSAQRGTLVFVDQTNCPTRPAILWSDTRRTDELAALPLLLRLGTRLIGAHQTLRDLRRRAPCNWIASHEADVWRKTTKVVLLSAYLNFRLTGRWIDSNASQVGFVPFHFQSRRWYPRGHWRWRALGHLRPEQMPQLSAPGTPLGSLCPAAAQKLALPATTQVLAAAADKACEVLGSGVHQPDDVALSFGTAVTVNVAHRRFRHVAPFIPAFPAATPAGYLSEAQLPYGFRIVPWFVQTVLKQHEMQRGSLPASALETFLGQSEPGANGLTQTLVTSADYQLAATRADAALVSAAAWRAEHSRAVLYRAMIEAMLLGLVAPVRTLTRSLRVRPARIIAAGGGVRSTTVRQIAADILGTDVYCPATDEATALGAAMCAAAGLQWYDSVEDARKQMSPNLQRTAFHGPTHNRYQSLHALTAIG